MCLIVHKPAGHPIAADLLEAALALNTDGFGAMGFARDGELILQRQPQITLEALLAFEVAHRDAELVLHLRKRTRGDTELHNTHPFRVTDGLYLMHNGTIRIPTPVAGRSDTWHFAHHLLRPLAERRPGLLLDPEMITLLELALRPENKLVLLDYPARRIALLNREHGAELDGLWLSSTRWIDRRILPLAHTPQPQERTYTTHDVHFL